MSSSENIWIKKIPIISSKGICQEDKILNEINLQQIASSYGFVPKIIKVDKDSTNYFITMENLNSMCLADKYGEEPNDIPDYFWDQMRCIVKILYIREGIEYIDITPYNFIELGDKIYLIDFGHARLKNKSKPINWFLKKFITSDSFNEYNPDFK